MLLGAVKILSGIKKKSVGEIRFFFQHPKEYFSGGAIEMVEAGVIKGTAIYHFGKAFSAVQKKKNRVRTESVIEV